MSMITMIKAIKQIHPKDIVMFKMESFYHTYSKDAYIMSYLFDYKTKKIEQNYSTCGFPSSSLAKNLAKLEKKKINYVIVDKRNNYEDDEKSDNKNLNQYDEIFEKAHKYVTIRNRIENINQELLKNIDEPNIKEKILKVEVAIKNRIRNTSYDLLEIAYTANATSDEKKKKELLEIAIAKIKVIDFY